MSKLIDYARQHRPVVGFIGFVIWALGLTVIIKTQELETMIAAFLVTVTSGVLVAHIYTPKN